MAAASSISKTPLAPFPTLGTPVTLQICSHLDYPALICFFSASRGTNSLREDNHQRLERNRFARIEIFDRKKWKEHTGAEVTDRYDSENIDIVTLRAFLKCYDGRHPLDRSIRVRDRCLIPTVVPRFYQVEGRGFHHCLNELGELFKRPGKGHAATYAYQTPALQQHGNTGLDRDKLVILLQGVVARNKPWSNPSEDPEKRGQVQCLHDINVQTEFGCTEAPDGLTQDTVLYAHHAHTGQRPYGDATGMEQQITCGRTRELVRYGNSSTNMVSGYFHAIGGSAPSGLLVDHNFFDNQSRGVGVLREF